ncbi:PleD family two-component system response regulator [Nocardia sp. NPDC056100]|uniref:response regulator n=1 Tax=Nocardia sp. NPDC056100 TaxID=3345712 RepID=UPI0035E32785
MEHCPAPVSRTNRPRLALGEHAGTPAKVLVVECNPAAAEVAVLILATAGYHSVQAMSGQRALGATMLWSPDLVLVDPLLPDMPGTRLCRQLRRRTTAPILMLSDRNDSTSLAHAAAAGVSECVPIPVETGYLLGRIHAHLHRSGDRGETDRRR